jgi:hypothetical protein
MNFKKNKTYDILKWSTLILGLGWVIGLVHPLVFVFILIVTTIVDSFEI